MTKIHSSHAGGGRTEQRCISRKKNASDRFSRV